MKNRKDILLAILLGAVLPILLLQFPIKNHNGNLDDACVVLQTEHGLQQMDLEEYLVGVLLREMPANFEEEALKAQAVAARTFALYRMEKGSKHRDADVCTSASCCQAYINPDDYISNGGDTSTVLKMYEAVNETKGQALFYHGNLIEATYFSSAGGRTEDAQAVWGVAVPYLQSVESGEGDITYTSEMKKEDFCTALRIPCGEVYVEAPIYTKGGGIAEIRINGSTFTGVQLRQLLGLRSTQIAIYVGSDTVQIITNGYGHRVGMSQYGADAMAVGGSNYTEILTHYYSGVTIQPYICRKN